MCCLNPLVSVLRASLNLAICFNVISIVALPVNSVMSLKLSPLENYPNCICIQKNRRKSGKRSSIKTRLQAEKFRPAFLKLNSAHKVDVIEVPILAPEFEDCKTLLSASFHLCSLRVNAILTSKFRFIFFDIFVDFLSRCLRGRLNFQADHLLQRFVPQLIFLSLLLLPLA